MPTARVPETIDVPRLETHRLVLRPMTLDDAGDMFAYASDPEVARTSTWEAHRGIEDSLSFLRFVLSRYDRRDGGGFGIVLKATGRLIGTIGLELTPQHMRGELGYAIGRAHWGQGLTSEAARAVIDWGFEHLNLNRIEARCLVDNTGSERVMQKCGMTFEGVLRRREFVKGRFDDMKIYSVLRGEWAAAKSSPHPPTRHPEGTRPNAGRGGVGHDELAPPRPALGEGGEGCPLQSSITITTLSPTDTRLIDQIAHLVVDAFAGSPFAWPDYAAALASVHDSFGDGRISLAAIDDGGIALGWIGGISGYGGNAWELHPLAVAPAVQRRGIGRALVRALEARAVEAGATTMWLTTDDSSGRTSLYGVELYPTVLEQLRGLHVRDGHPIAFYQRLGYALTGVIPDAYGRGMPEFVLARRLIP